MATMSNDDDRDQERPERPPFRSAEHDQQMSDLGRDMQSDPQKYDIQDVPTFHSGRNEWVSGDTQVIILILLVVAGLLWVIFS
jgi:hypothetical protein